MTSSDSSTSVRVISPSRSGESSHGDPEVSSSGASSEPPSLVDARVQRDLEVMMSDHDLDSTVTEGSLAVIRARYNIPTEYGLHVPEPGQHPYSLDVPGMCISVDALEADLRFPLHPLIDDGRKVEVYGLSRQLPVGGLRTSSLHLFLELIYSFPEKVDSFSHVHHPSYHGTLLTTSSRHHQKENGGIKCDGVGTRFQACTAFEIASQEGNGKQQAEHDR
ncbi:hypothetical protein BHE74_00038604 [Ensete ventricosum]|nr:hypothetical protein BHE74_00038604 [Ensete ventricosum]